MRKQKDQIEKQKKLRKITLYVPEEARNISRNILDHNGILDTTVKSFKFVRADFCEFKDFCLFLGM